MVGKPVFIIAIITIGVDIVVRVVAGAFIGVDLRSIGDPWGTKTLAVGSVVIEQRHLAMLLTGAVVVAALFTFFRHTLCWPRHAGGRAGSGSRAWPKV